MKESMLSVGIDLGTTTTQMIVSRLSIQNTASAFSVPHMEISDREILYRSDIYFTPLLDADTLDAGKIKQIISREYEKANIRPEEIQTGAVIITGETARKENARQVLSALSDLAGSFVVATAGPALESVLAARGAGADRYAEQTGCYVLHFDIGGGTSNLALFDPDGKLVDTGCLNIGGRLIKMTDDGLVQYVSAVLPEVEQGKKITPYDLQPVIDMLVQALEEAAGLRPPGDCLKRFITDKTVDLPAEPIVISFSGGVADLIREREENWLRYGDIGVLLANAIRDSLLCKNAYRFGEQTLRATVVGAGSYSTELSGSTVTCIGAKFPMQDLPAVELSKEQMLMEPTELSRVIQQKASLYDNDVIVLAMEGILNPSYAQIRRLAQGIGGAVKKAPVVVALRCDMAKALGQALQGCIGKDIPIICLDGIHVPEGSYLDVAAPVAGGTAVPVVVKTLAFS